MKQTSPMAKGAITAAVMIILSLVSFYVEGLNNSAIGYFIYFIYGAGILWTLISYSRTEAYKGKFGELFVQGFRCFIVITLIMVAFTAVFSLTHPEMAEKSAQYYKEELVKKKDKTPDEIEKEVASYKSSFTTQLVSVSIFGYLLIGAVLTAGSAVVVLMRRR